MLGEFALVTVDRTRVEQLAAQGDRGAARVLASLRRLSFELSGAQLGITLTSLVLGFVGEPVLADLIEPALDALPGVDVEPGTGASVLTALALATMVQMVFGELAPKSWAIARPLGTARAVVLPFGLFAAVFGALIRVLNGGANLVVRALGVEPREELSSVRSLEELDLLIRSSMTEGTLEESTHPLLARALAFREKSAADALVPRVSVEALPLTATIGDLVAAALSTGHSRFPVFEGDLDDVVGVVHVKDAATVERERWNDTVVGGIVAPVLSVPESRSLGPLFTDMRLGRHQLVVVVDEYGGTAGIITAEDVLEEIVGEIEDEYDRRSPQPLAFAGVYVVSGMARPHELEEHTGFVMPKGDFETLGGFLLAVLGHIPSVGERIEHAGWEIEVVSMDGKRVERVRLSGPPTGGPVDGSDETSGEGGGQP